MISGSNGGVVNVMGAGSRTLSGATVLADTVNITGGALNVQSGNLSALGNATLGAGSATTVSGGSFGANGAMNIGGTLIHDGGAITATTMNVLGGGVLTENGGVSSAQTFNNAGTVNANSNLTIGNGSDSGVYNIAANASLDMSGTRTWNNGVSFNGSGSLSINGTVNNSATLNLSRDIGGEGALNNLAGGVINAAGLDTTHTYSPFFSNAGTLNISNTGDVYTLELLGDTANSGTIQIGDLSTLRVSFGDLSNSGVIGGSGSIELGQGQGQLGTLFNSGTLQPGASPGTLSILGNLVLDASSVLNLELGGIAAGQFDMINVSGSATLGGTANTLQSGGFIANVGDTFTVLTANSVNGNFAAVNSPAAFTVMPVIGADNVSLSVASVTPTMPPITQTQTDAAINTALPSVFTSVLDVSALPNAGSPSGADNSAGSTSSAQTTSSFNALLEAAPTAAIGLESGGSSENLIQILTQNESYLSPNISGVERNARLLCR